MSDMLLFLEYRISMVFLLAYMLTFLELEYSRIRSILMAMLCFIITGIMEWAIFFGSCPSWMNTSILVLEILTVQITAWLLSSYRDMRAIFTGITAATYVLPGNVLYMGLLSFERGKEAWWLLLVPTGIHFAILWITAYILRDRYLREMENKSRLWNELWIVPAFFYGITYMLTMWTDSFFRTWQNWVAIFMILILMDIIYIFTIRLVSKLHDEEEMRSGRKLLEVYAESLRQQTSSLKKMEEDFRYMRHDNKYRYQLIRNCLENGQPEQIKEILDQTEEEFQRVTEKKFCNNVVLNGAIAVYEGKAREQNIMFQCQARLPEQLEQLNEFEFATVVMNLLDNAVRAAAQIPEEQFRQVWIKIHPVKSQIFLEVSNTFAGNHKISRVTGFPLSDQGEGHGLGMRSVQAYANKNQALFKYSIENGKFCVQLLTQI